MDVKMNTTNNKYNKKLNGAISSTNVAILLLLFKRAIIAPNKLIDRQHQKRHEVRTTVEFHSPSNFTLTNTQ